MSRQFLDAIFRAADSNFNPVPGALCYHYIAGTTTRVDTYSDAAMAVPHAWPVVALSDGTWPQIYLPDGTYKIVIKTAAGVTLYTVDNVLQVSSGGLTFDTLALASSSFVPTTTKYATVAGLDYVQDASGTAWQSSNGVKFSPFGTIMPAHWAANTTPFTTDMSAACLAMGRWLAATNGPHRRVYWGNIGVSSPILLGIGTGGASWSGYISNITFTGGQIRSIGSTRWAGVASSGILVYPASLIILAGDTTYSSENIKFERTKFDPRYLCGSIYLENTNYVTIADNYFVGLGCDKAHIQTSIVKAAANVDGKNAKNTELHIDCNKFHGADSSASNMVGRAIDGICASQAASAGVALTLNGVDISGGEWVTPDGYPSPIGFRVDSTTPQGQAGKRITVNGFADVARTIPLSEVVTYFEWSTQWQHSSTSAFYAVVTSIVPVDTFGINVAVLAERNTTGIWMESADFWLDSNSYKGMTRSNFYNHFANGNVTNDHPYTRSFEVGSDCEGINFSGLYMDFHDGIFYSHGHMFHDSFFLAGNPAIHLLSNAGNTSGDGFSFQGNSAMPNRSYSTKGQIFKRHTGDTPWDAVLNIQKVGNAHAISLGETDDMIRIGRTRNFAIVADALTVPTEYSITLDSSTAMRFNTNSNSGTSSDIHNFHFGFDGTYLTEFTYDGHYFFGQGLGSAGNGALAIDAGSAYPVIFANGIYAKGIKWNDLYQSWEFLGDGVGILARSPAGTLYRLAPPNGGGAATWVAP